RCQQDNPSQAKFCLDCGAPVGAVAATGGSYAELQAEIEVLRRSLTEGPEQQTATTEILRVISASPTDAQPVFDAIAQSAMRRCEGNFANVVRYDGELLHLAAYARVSVEGVDAMRQTFPVRPRRGLAMGRAVLDGAVVHIPDVKADAEYDQPFGEALRVR